MLRHRALIAALSAAPLLAQDPGNGPTVEMPGIRKITIGGEYRLRYESFFDYDLNSDAGATTDFFSQRVRTDFGLELADGLKAFVQFQDAREFGEETSTTDDSADGFDLHQGYVDIANTPGIGGSTRLGRMEVNLGDQRLVGALNWATGARALDGVLQTWTLDDKSALHFFVFQAGEAMGSFPISVAGTPDMNDDAQFGGLYYAREMSDGVNGEFYFMHLHNDGPTVGGVVNVSTLGTRWDIAANDQLSFNVELATQFGDVSGADVPIGDTYAGHAGATWKFGGDMNPRLTAAFDIASGDDPNTADFERFNNLFPTGHAHWGMMDLAKWSNLINPWIRIAIAPCERSDLSLTFLNLQANEEADSFGGPRGMLSGGGTESDMGNEIDLVFTRKLDWGGSLKSSVQLGLGLFLPGDGAKAYWGNDDMAEFFYAQFNLDY